jgi:hypothetical protein
MHNNTIPIVNGMANNILTTEKLCFSKILKKKLTIPTENNIENI